MEGQTRPGSLQETLRKNPQDTFARYALALELSKGAQPEAAWENFEYLLIHHPEYSATYDQAGLFLIEQGRREEAMKILRQGIEVTQRQGSRQAQSRLQAALEELGSEF
jgi:tetratricopeptide (TPR) repeat protein